MISATIIALVVVCRSLVQILKMHYLNFYRKQKHFIIGMVIALSISALFRVIFNVWLTYRGSEFEIIIKDSG